MPNLLGVSEVWQYPKSGWAGVWQWRPIAAISLARRQEMMKMRCTTRRLGCW